MKLLVVFRSFAYGPKHKVPYRQKFFLSVPIQNDLNLEDFFFRNRYSISFYNKLLGKPKKTRETYKISFFKGITVCFKTLSPV
jgi:hypothetical protein